MRSSRRSSARRSSARRSVPRRSSKRRSSRGSKKISPWIQHVMAYHKAHPELSYKQAMSRAKSSYKTGYKTPTHSQPDY
jgi:hypothetical protein